MSDSRYDAIIDADVDLESEAGYNNDFDIEAADPMTTPTGLIDEPAATSKPRGGIFSVSRYAQYFDVETAEVLKRCWAAIFPRQDFYEGVMGNKPDLWGPFWIATTVAFVLFSSSTIVGYVASHAGGLQYYYDFGLLSAAAGIMYAYTFIVPLVLYLGLVYYKSEHANILECLTLYGYSNVVWIPVAIVATAPFQLFGWNKAANIIRWIATAVGYSISLLFLVRNLNPVLKSTDSRTARMLLIVIIALHTGLAIAVKFTFFHYKV
ncbi:hypothetical protein CANCADRAFT_1081 [Tortispora caseinolytica NRRL Y-17796]|uniref:Protein YIP n=1 Tax=Tortispora caseinolytica NRRL Y-17796 TaxID=767744 RepID=A0A1E4TL84_9ASCO|nr:hypothetical protein CANCADRAFT_1081 [Tortispora caseinolytica NRRL Y-17796]